MENQQTAEASKERLKRAFRELRDDIRRREINHEKITRAEYAQFQMYEQGIRWGYGMEDPEMFMKALRSIRKWAQSLKRQQGAKRFIDGPDTLDFQMERYDVPERLQVNHKSYFTSEYMLKQYARADWQNCDYRIQVFAARFIQEMRRNNAPFFVVWAYRTYREQRQFVRDGASKTPPPIAAHCQGCAVDIIHAVHGYNMSKEEWRFVRTVANRIADKMNIELVYGFDWGWDSAHFELKDWRKIAKHSIPQKEPIRKTPTKILSELGAREFKPIS